MATPSETSTSLLILCVLTVLYSGWTLVTLTPHYGKDVVTVSCSDTHTDQDSCVADHFCGWCTSTSTCSEGGMTGPYNVQCPADDWKYAHPTTASISQTLGRKSTFASHALEYGGRDYRRVVLTNVRVAEGNDKEPRLIEVTKKPAISSDSYDQSIPAFPMLKEMSPKLFPVEECKAYIDGTVLFTSLEGEWNYWHMHMENLLGIFFSMVEFHEPQDPKFHLVLIDDTNSDMFRSWFQVLNSNPVRYLSHIPVGTCIKRAIVRESRFNIDLRATSQREYRNSAVIGAYAKALKSHFLGPNWFRSFGLRPNVNPVNATREDTRFIVTIINRVGAYNRAIRNIDSLFSKMVDRAPSHLPIHFQIVYPEKMTKLQQATVFANTDILIGVRGAGLTNMFFLPPSAMVVEILPFSLPQFGTTYSELARCLKLSPRGFYNPRELSALNFARGDRPGAQQALKTLGMTKEEFAARAKDWLSISGSKDETTMRAFDYLYVEYLQHQDVIVPFHTLEEYITEAVDSWALHIKQVASRLNEEQRAKQDSKEQKNDKEL